MKTELFQSILGNTAVKLTGVNETKSLKILATETGETVENLQTHLAIGRFSLWQKAKIGDTQKPPVFVSMPTNTLKNKQGMSKEQWEALKTAQIEAFYRSTVKVHLNRKNRRKRRFWTNLTAILTNRTYDTQTTAIFTPAGKNRVYYQ